MAKIVNKIIKTLIISDFFLNLGWGFLAPVFAIFIVQNVSAGSMVGAAKIAGFASLIYWLIKSILQIPIGNYLDKNHGEIDDFWFMVLGTFILAFVPLGYIISTQAWHIYLLQVIYAVGAAINFPSWSAIFTRHIDKGREAAEWSAHSTFLGFAAGVAGGLGGIAVALLGFNFVFIFVSAFTFLAGILLLIIKNDISPKNEDTIRIPIERNVAEL